MTGCHTTLLRAMWQIVRHVEIFGKHLKVVGLDTWRLLIGYEKIFCQTHGAVGRALEDCCAQCYRNRKRFFFYSNAYKCCPSKNRVDSVPSKNRITRRKQRSRLIAIYVSASHCQFPSRLSVLGRHATLPNNGCEGDYLIPGLRKSHLHLSKIGALILILTQSHLRRALGPTGNQKTIQDIFESRKTAIKSFKTEYSSERRVIWLL